LLAQAKVLGSVQSSGWTVVPPHPAHPQLFTEQEAAVNVPPNVPYEHVLVSEAQVVPQATVFA